MTNRLFHEDRGRDDRRSLIDFAETEVDDGAAPRDILN